MEQKTPLCQRHLALGGTMVPFGGFLMPVQYPTGILKEHLAVREHAGIFDVSHMGEALLKGPDALAALNGILTNTFDSLPTGGCRYALMLYENGGCVDDLIVYRFGENEFFLVLNASNTQKDLGWLRSHISGDAVLTDLSPRVAQIALQGPDSKAVLSQFAQESGFPVKYYTFVPSLNVAGVDCLISRTGYTGEFGYELYMAPEHAGEVWDALLSAGAVPCGLGTRDTLRLEAAMPLYGHELSENIDPMTAGLGFAVKLDHPFIGRGALLAKGAPAQKRVGLKVTGRGILRERLPVFLGERQIGMTTSGTYCPRLGFSCAMAYVDIGSSDDGTAVEVETRGRRIPCQIVPLPFYSRTKK